MTQKQKIMRDKTIGCIVMAVAILFLLVGNLYLSDVDWLKPKLADQTWQQIEQRVELIGEKKAKMIVKYLNEYPDASIDDLEYMDGIGRITVIKLEKVYK